MKRKSAPKSKSRKKTKRLLNSYSPYIVIGIAVVIILLLAGILVKATGRIVLGESTGPVLLADHGGDQPDQPDTNQSGDQQQSGSTPQPTSDVHNSSDSQSSDTLVDCVKPDGTHVTTSFHDCQDLNHQMGQNTFHFTSLTKPEENNNQQPEPTGEATHQSTDNLQGRLEVQTEGSKGELNLETAGLHIQMKREDNGSVKIIAHKADGTEVQLQTDALDKINEALKENDVEVSTTSANGFAIRSAGVQAETNFPLSIDPITKSLTVTTPAGTKVVTTLPNQAVENALQQGQLTNVLSTANQSTPSATASSNTVALTELNNQPVYAIEGVLNKNLFGFFPMAYRRTVYVSLQDGQIVQTQQALLTQILQALSF